MEKKIVHYSSIIPSMGLILGYPTFVNPIDHTSPLVSNTKACLTSPIIFIDTESGEFHTLNSIYKPIDCDALESFKKTTSMC